MNRLLIVLAAIFMTGCAGCVTSPEVVRADVAVGVRCIGKTPERPKYRYGKGQEPKNSAQKAKILASDFEAADRYGTQWETAASGCVK